MEITISVLAGQVKEYSCFNLKEKTEYYSSMYGYPVISRDKGSYVVDAVVESGIDEQREVYIDYEEVME